MSSREKFATLSIAITSEEVLGSSQPENAVFETPVLKFAADARNKGYDTICLPLTTAEWKQRWTDMCLLPVGSDRDRDMDAEARAEEWRSRPAFLPEEVTITRLGA
jgi:protein arginine N-methyltransferase 5